MDARLQRIKLLEAFGDCKSIKNGIYELRFITSSGPRVYFAKDGNQVVLLLVGGNKGTQSKDISKAKEYWLDFKTRRNTDGKS